MSNVNVQVSVTNLTQMDRHQSDTHRAPMINQEQNADHARQEAMRRVIAPAAPDGAEGKKIDPQAKREEDARKKRKKQRTDALIAAKRIAGPLTRVVSSSGHSVDYTV